MDEFEILDLRFRAYVLPNASLVKLGEGFRLVGGPGLVRGPGLSAGQRPSERPNHALDS